MANRSHDLTVIIKSYQRYRIALNIIRKREIKRSRLHHATMILCHRRRDRINQTMAQVRNMAGHGRVDEVVFARC